jgi:hypothetical protein
LCLDARDGIHDQDGTIQDSDAPIDLDGKVYMPRRINQCNLEGQLVERVHVM